MLYLNCVGCEAEVYQRWLDYAEQIYEKLTQIDDQLLGTREQALAVVSIFAQYGQVSCI